MLNWQMIGKRQWSGKVGSREEIAPATCVAWRNLVWEEGSKLGWVRTGQVVIPENIRKTKTLVTRYHLGKTTKKKKTLLTNEKQSQSFIPASNTISLLTSFTYFLILKLRERKKERNNFKRPFRHLFLCSKHSCNIIKISFVKGLISHISSSALLLALVFLFLYKTGTDLRDTLRNSSSWAHLPFRWGNHGPARLGRCLRSHSKSLLSKDSGGWGSSGFLAPAENQDS